MWRRRNLGNESQLYVVDYLIDDVGARDKSDDLHLLATLCTKHKIGFINFADHLGPATLEES